MLEQQALIGQLVAQQLHSIESLRQLGLTFVDEISDVLCKHNTDIQQFLSSQKSLNEARTWWLLFHVRQKCYIFLSNSLGISSRNSTHLSFSHM